MSKYKQGSFKIPVFFILTLPIIDINRTFSLGFLFLCFSLILSRRNSHAFKRAFGRILFLLTGLSLLGELSLSLALAHFSGTGSTAESNLILLEKTESSYIQKQDKENSIHALFQSLTSENESEEDLLDWSLFAWPSQIEEFVFGVSEEHISLLESPISFSRDIPLYLRFCSLKIPSARI